jgi:hypothetical protein
VHKRLVFEVGDDLLDNGVIAMLSLDHGDVLGPVGDEAEVTPVGPQLCLRAWSGWGASLTPAACLACSLYASDAGRVAHSRRRQTGFDDPAILQA